jgi:DNA polymerase V
VGRGLVEQYRQAGLVTVADLLATDTDRVSRLFGVTGVRLQAELRGESVLPVGSTRPLQKTLMSSRSFSCKTSDMAILADAVAYHARHIATDLRSMDAVAGSIRVSLQTSRYGDFFLRGGSNVAVLAIPTNDTFVFMAQAQTLLDTLYEPDVPYQKVGIVVSEIVPNASLSQSLFETVTPNKTSGLDTFIDTLNRRVDGKELVVLGSRLRTNDWQAKATARSGSYTTRWSDIAQVSAR